MNLVMGLVVRVLAIMVAAYVVPGVTLDGVWGALVVAIVLGLLNSFVKPILLVLTLPITVLTLGLFALVVNTAMVMVADYLVPGFGVAGFWPALTFGIVVGLVNWFLGRMEK